MELSGLHSKACKMWKDKDSLVAGHFWGGGGAGGKRRRTHCREGMGTQFQSPVIDPEEQTVILSSLVPSWFGDLLFYFNPCILILFHKQYLGCEL